MKWIVMIVWFYSSLAWSLSSEQVVRSSLNHFPKVITAVQNLEVKANEWKAARGEFDGKISGEMNSRVDGYYTGDLYDVKVEKPIPYFNSKVFGGHRQSYGNFPVYEGKRETLDRGEDYLGFSVSLLRNSLIDQNRYNIRFLEQEKQQAEINLQSIKSNVQTMALKAYWTWFVAGHELKVYESILDLANSRVSQLKKRIKAGDLARIYALENNQYITKRKAQVTQKQMEFQEAAFYLSLFNRDPNGAPITPQMKELPSIDSLQFSSPSSEAAVAQRALQTNLELQQLISEQEQAQLDVKLGNNDLLPDLNVKYEWSRDRGQGPTQLAQQENRVMLKLEIPFEYRKGLGKKRAGKAKLEGLKAEQRLAREKIVAQSNTLVTKLRSFYEIFKLTGDQVQLAEKLAQAERRKFSQGDSDLILVNIREENLAEAQIKNLASLLKYYFVDADLKNLQVDILAH